MGPHWGGDGRAIVAIHVAVIDDHALVVSALCSTLGRSPELIVVGTANAGAEAVAMVESVRPDVTLLDLGLPDIDGLDLIPVLRDACPSNKVLVVTGYDDPARARAALRAGACGYVPKNRPLEDLLRAIRLVHQGRMHIDVAIDGGQTPDTDSGPEPDLLSVREREVIELVALGHTNREVAELLAISSNSVSTYRARIAEKLGLRRRVDLVRFVLEHGLLDSTRQRLDS